MGSHIWKYLAQCLYTVSTRVPSSVVMCPAGQREVWVVGMDQDESPLALTLIPDRHFSQGHTGSCGS